MPQGFLSSIPPVAVATGDLAVVRFHGRNSEEWESGSVQRRFKYLSSKQELGEWAPRIEKLSGEAKSDAALECTLGFVQARQGVSLRPVATLGLLAPSLTGQRGIEKAKMS